MSIGAAGGAALGQAFGRDPKKFMDTFKMFDMSSIKINGIPLSGIPGVPGVSGTTDVAASESPPTTPSDYVRAIHMERDLIVAYMRDVAPKFPAQEGTIVKLCDNIENGKHIDHWAPPKAKAKRPNKKKAS